MFGGKWLRVGVTGLVAVGVLGVGLGGVASGQRVRAERLAEELEGAALGTGERLDRRLERARALLSWNVPEALEACRGAAEEARRHGRDDYLALALAVESRIAAKTRGAAPAMELMERARATMPPDADVELRGQLEVIDVGLLYTIDEYGLAASTLEVALELAEQAGSRELMADCLLELHDLFYVTETGHEPTADLRRAEQLLTELGDARGLLRVRLRWADVWMQQGREREAEQALHEVLEQAVSAGDRVAMINARDTLVYYALDHDDFDAAIELSRGSIEISEQLASDEIVARENDNLAWSYLMAGRPEEAAPYVERALEIAERLEIRVLLCAVVDSAAELALARQDGEAMLEYARRANDLAEAELGRATRDEAAARRVLREIRAERRALNEAAGRREAELAETQRRNEERLAVYRWSAAGVALLLTSVGSLLLYRGKRRAERMHRRLVEQTELAQRTEEARKQLERQLRELERLDGLGLLAAGIAHDFNNILCSIGGNAELLLDALPDDRRGLAENVLQASHRAADLCSRLLDYARPSPADRRVADLRDVVAGVRPLLDAGGRGAATLRLDLGPAPVPAEVDRTAIEQVLINLVTNAQDASVGAATITVRVRRHEDVQNGADGTWFGQPTPSSAHAVLEVTDDGNGLKPDMLRRVFDPFFTTKFAGRGLGLFAAYSIVKSHGGAFHVTSREGRGTTFAAFLPVSEAPLAADPDELPPSSTPVPPARSPRPGVLAVDDEAGILSFVQNALAGADHDVFVASSAPEAQRVLREHAARIGVVLLDLSMPEMDGAELLAILRREHPDLPVVVMSGHAESFVRDRIGDHEVAAILRKPFGVATLRETLERADETAPAGAR